jgi:hypothetical protein
MKTKIQKIIVLVSISSLAVIFSMSSQAEIYKWVDDNGQTHYTATPPVQKMKRVKATNIEDKIRSAAGKYRPPAKGSEPTKSTDDTAQKSGNTEKEELGGPDKKLVEYCKNQRNNLAQLKKNFRNVWVDIKGKKTSLDQEQRKEKVAYLKSRIKEDCAGVNAN